MSEDKLSVPQFNTEAEEAEWWADNQDLLADRFESAAAEGRLQDSSVARRAREQSASITPAISLDVEDISRARRLAANRGLLYEIYLKRLVHEALDAEEKKQAS